MKTRGAVHAMTMLGNALIALSLLSGLLWWRASVAFFVACALAHGGAQVLHAAGDEPAPER